MITYEELLYGSSYNLFFDIAEYLYATNPNLISDDWEFQPGLSSGFLDPDNPIFYSFKNTDPANLVKLGNELSQFIDQCKKDGTAY